MKKVIEVKDVSISFGSKEVLNELDFHIEEKEVFGFLGPSGAGKTTTIKLLTEQLKADRGRIKVDFTKEEIGILTDNSGLYERLTVYENLLFFAELQKVDKEQIESILKRVHLWEDRNKKAKMLSKGMKQRLILARAILHKPKLLFLDEPTAALDPATTAQIHSLLLEMNKAGTTIFLTTHNMEEADKLCNRVAFLDKGKIIELGTPSELKIKYAKDNIKIIYKNNTEKVIKKDRECLIDELKDNKNDNILSIHSEEPNLEQIFLELTGRDLK